MDKKTELYSQCCEILDNIQGTIYQILEADHGTDKDKWYLLKMATDIVRDYESLSPEVKTAMEEINNKIDAGEITIAEALDMVTSAAPKKQVDNKKKLLLN